MKQGIGEPCRGLKNDWTFTELHGDSLSNSFKSVLVWFSGFPGRSVETEPEKSTDGTSPYSSGDHGDYKYNTFQFNTHTLMKAR